MQGKKVYLVAGARPNFIKIAPLYSEFEKTSFFKAVIVHTGQHYDKTMSHHVFDDLEMPEPHIQLNVGSGTHGVQTAKIMERFEKICLKRPPELVVAVGDVNSSLAASIVSAKLAIPLAHVEAGLRSFDRTMPEEINRIVTDNLSDYLFTTTRNASKNLKEEGIPKDKIFFAGNVMIDTLMKFKKKSEKSIILNKLEIKEKEYAVLTLHRPSNVDNRKAFNNLKETLKAITKKITIVFPVHPRTRKQMKKFGAKDLLKYAKCIEPLGYIDFLQILSKSRFVLTDSGGIQEETTMLQVPCLTLRKNTERPITVECGTNVICGLNKEKIMTEVENILDNEPGKKYIPDLWDGRAAQRIVKRLRHRL